MSYVHVHTRVYMCIYTYISINDCFRLLAREGINLYVIHIFLLLNHR